MPCDKNDIDKPKFELVISLDVMIPMYTSFSVPPKIKKDTRLPFAMICSSLGMRVPNGGASSLNIKPIE